VTNNIKTPLQVLAPARAAQMDAMHVPLHVVPINLSFHCLTQCFRFEHFRNKHFIVSNERLCLLQPYKQLHHRYLTSHQSDAAQ
jgi:hypothetical protein